ncbi:hypothetical protein H7Q97_00675 [Ochrobactrum sp. CM-21-5]|nr:hypothetical protein [Ochrobactrum sp. CM-21-5]MBC2883912.1 hypothetical protein [Ochrobactrum sp. CM-21-5]
MAARLPQRQQQAKAFSLAMDIADTVFIPFSFRSWPELFPMFPLERAGLIWPD